MMKANTCIYYGTDHSKLLFYLANYNVCYSIGTCSENGIDCHTAECELSLNVHYNDRIFKLTGISVVDGYFNPLIGINW
jgi:hypothetical protein